MSEKKSSKSVKAPAKQSQANAMIAARLKTYYDELVEEGTPDQFLDLLERLDAAEQAAKSKSDKA
ncbi:NepR family anti-sigma factor [Agrobacterium vitis]|uniref:NepR family anti-sigma factor n=1 Tax=Agrobacterium vitis TaxID=373 RepID=UPI0012E7CE66|nr:NepR family anti-sigma factor [Agrobacterium vitis]MVA63461.1 hypothetical protein [Agrobacterium vitis]